MIDSLKTSNKPHRQIQNSVPYCFSGRLNSLFLQQHINDLLTLIHIFLELSHVIHSNSIDFLLMQTGKFGGGLGQLVF
jgi:hypothetical protein